MPAAPGDIIRVAARHLFESIDEQINVFHFTVQAAPDPADDELLKTDLATQVSMAYAEIAGEINSAVSAYDLTFYNVTDDYPMGVHAFNSGYAGGTSVGDCLPPGTAGLVIWRTATKRVLGKTYLPTFSENTQDRGAVGLTARTHMQDFADALSALLVQANDYSFRLGIWSREAGEMRPITSSAPGLRIAYQRRRKAGVGS